MLDEDICGFAVMDNHLHVVVRTRPDVAATWSEEEVARRWWPLFPRRRDEHGQPAEPEAHELGMLVADAGAVAERRRRLSSLSWFMRRLSEPIACSGPSMNTVLLLSQLGQQSYTGKSKDAPDFQEIVRLGAEIRNADRPQ